MASKIVDSLYPKVPPLLGNVGNSTTIAVGDLLYFDTTNSVLKPATASVGITTNLAGVSTQAVTTTGATTATVKYIPIDRAMRFVVDCTNNTAANQLYKQQAMTNAATVANTSSAIATTLGVFLPLATVGAASAKQLYGIYLVTGQVTA